MKTQEFHKTLSKTLRKSEDFTFIDLSDYLLPSEIDSFKQKLKLVVLNIEYPFTEGRDLKEDVIYQGGFYSGEFKGNKRHGIGLFITTPGAIYHGQWKNDQPSGQGVLTFKEVRYEGGFLNSEFHGYGEYETSSYIYQGDWDRNKRSGKGIEIYKFDSSSYEGEFLNDKRHGKGTITTQSLSLHVSFSKDRFTKGVYRDSQHNSTKFTLFPSKLIQDSNEKLKITIRNFQNPKIKLRFHEGPTTFGIFTSLESRSKIFLLGVPSRSDN